MVRIFEFIVKATRVCQKSPGKWTFCHAWRWRHISQEQWVSCFCCCFIYLFVCFTPSCEFCFGGVEFGSKEAWWLPTLSQIETCRWLAKKMAPQRYQVLLPGTWSLTLFGEKVFANMNKYNIFKRRDNPKLSEWTLNATTGKWEAEEDSTGTEESKMTRQSRERVDDAGFEDWSDVVTSEGVTCSHQKLEETMAGFYPGTCRHVNTLILAQVRLISGFWFPELWEKNGSHHQPPCL